MVLIDDHQLSLEDAWRVVTGTEVALSTKALEKVSRSRTLIEQMIARGDTVYGVTTGFGHLAQIPVPSEDAAALQEDLVRSHAAGVGPDLPTAVVRSMLLLRLKALARGNSGVRPIVLERLIAFLNAGLHPCIPSQGSVGASGDLAPLAHLAAALLGEGEAEMGGVRAPVRSHLAALGLPPLTLAAKEGLALTNGTQLMASLALIAWHQAKAQLQAAAFVAALTFQALGGIASAYDPDLLAARPHHGALAVGAEMRRLLEGSTLVTKTGQRRVQDAYSLRCIPQVHGAVLDAFRHVEAILLVEINAATDNPLVFAERGEVVSGGNFHGQPIAIALDYLAIALTELGSISERRTERLVNPALSGLPAFLSSKPGLRSGLMLAQYTAAALVSENKTLAHPASVDSIPTSANQEDFVSMGAWAGLKLQQVVANLWQVLSAEALCASRAVALVGQDGLSSATAPFFAGLQATVPPEPALLSSQLKASADFLMDWFGGQGR
ncbi:MAG: histidine ammonia-lyase [Sulfobacillus sp.]